MSLNAKTQKALKERYITIVGDKQSLDILGNIMKEVSKRMNYTTVMGEPKSGIPVPDIDLAKFLSYKLSKNAFEEMAANISSAESVRSLTLNLGGDVIEYPKGSVPSYITKMNKLYSVLKDSAEKHMFFDPESIYKAGMTGRPINAIEGIVYADNLNLHIPPDKGTPPVFMYDGNEYNAGYVVAVRLQDGAIIDFDKKLKIDKQAFNNFRDYLWSKHHIAVPEIHTLGDYLRFVVKTTSPYLFLSDPVVGEIQVGRFRDDRGNIHRYALLPVYGNTTTSQDIIKPIKVPGSVTGILDDILA